MEKEKSLDRLVTVSKLFRDARFEQVCRENADLRLQLFWKDHNVQALITAMEHANNRDNSPKCNCWNCAVSGRMDEEVGVYESKPCEFILWIEEKITICGLTSGRVLPESTPQEHTSDTWNSVWDVDCHFVKIPMVGGEWSAFTYGAKLWSAKTINDPELKKLEKLFELLNVDELSD